MTDQLVGGTIRTSEELRDLIADARPTKVEYRVRPITRYIVTVWQSGAYESEDGSKYGGSVGSYGEFANEVHAAIVARALGKQSEAAGMETLYPDLPEGIQE